MNSEWSRSFHSRGGVVAAFAGAQIVGLRGARLAGHLDAVERQLGSGRGAVIDDAGHGACG